MGMLPITSTLLLLADPAAAAAAEQAAVRQPLENYLRAHATGDSQYIYKAFRDSAHIEGFRPGAGFVSYTLEEYAKLFRNAPSPEEPQRKRHIESIDIAGTAAMAKIRFDYPNVVIVDYLLLLKFGEEWKIVNKIYHSEPKQK